MVGVMMLLLLSPISTFAVPAAKTWYARNEVDPGQPHLQKRTDPTSKSHNQVITPGNKSRNLKLSNCQTDAQTWLAKGIGQRTECRLRLCFVLRIEESFGKLPKECNNRSNGAPKLITTCRQTRSIAPWIPRSIAIKTSRQQK
eukprot:3699906-Amphidinium_carterae.1